MKHVNTVERTFILAGSIVAFILGGLQIYEIVTKPNPGRLDLSYNYTDQAVFPVGLDADRQEGHSDRFPIGVIVSNTGEMTLRNVMPKMVHASALKLTGRGIELQKRQLNSDFVPFPLTETTFPKIDLHPGQSVNLDSLVAVVFDYSNGLIEVSKDGETVVPLHIELVAENHPNVEVARCFAFAPADALLSFDIEHWVFSPSSTEHREGMQIPREISMCAI